jgi:hypothetical protein
MKKSAKRALCLALSMALSSVAHSATVVCSGTVDQLAYHQPGQILLRLSSMNVPVVICSTDVEWNVPGSLSGATSPSACKTLYATLLTSKLTHSQVSSMYFDGDQVPSTCNSFVDWTRVNLRYFHH